MKSIFTSALLMVSFHLALNAQDLTELTLDNFADQLTLAIKDDQTTMVELSLVRHTKALLAGMYQTDIPDTNRSWAQGAFISPMEYTLKVELTDDITEIGKLNREFAFSEICGEEISMLSKFQILALFKRQGFSLLSDESEENNIKLILSR